MVSQPRVLVVPGDPLAAYVNKGYADSERHAYYNPAEAFDVTLLEASLYESSLYPFSKMRYAGFPVIHVGSDLDGLDDALGGFRPDLVRGYGDSAHVISRIAQMYDVPSLLSVHDLHDHSNLDTVDTIICVSHAVKEKLQRDGIPEDRLVVIYDRVDLDLFRPYNPFLLHKPALRSVSAGRCVWEKNLENLIAATEIVGDALDGYYEHLHFGGSSGELLESIRKLAEKSSYFKLLPSKSQEELAREFSHADCFAMASVSEGFGLVYAEALACGVPVVTSNMPPMTEYITEGFNGLLANPYSPEDFAEKVIYLMNNNDFRHNLGSNARDVAQNFDAILLSHKERDLYYSLISQNT